MKIISILLISVFWCGQSSWAADNKGFADLVKKTGNGVVNISTYTRQRIQMRPGFPGMQGGPQDDLFRRFFEEFFGGRLDGPGSDPRLPKNFGSKNGKLVPMGLGTGFVIDSDSGLILTNHHVIDQSEEVKIQFVEDDQELIPAEIIGKDPELDVALLKVKTKLKMTALPLGDSDAVDVGDYVIAIGNPLGYGHTVSHGILSAKGRRNPEFNLGKYLQTDASINPGNSGGPLLNLNGEVIGINNAIDARAQGIGFAIPINLVKRILSQLKNKGSVSRGYLGISAGELNAETLDQLNLDPKTRGVLVVDVAPGQPAEKSGIKPFDVILSVNQVRVWNPQELTAQVTSIPVGEKTQVVLLRNGKEKTIELKVAERPVEGISQRSPVPGNKPTEPKLARMKVFEEYGFAVEDIHEQNAKTFGISSSELKGDSRVIVTELEYDKPAVNSGLNRGDVILDVSKEGNHFAVKNTRDLEKFLSDAKGKPLMLRVKQFDPRGNSQVKLIVLKK